MEKTFLCCTAQLLWKTQSKTDLSELVSVWSPFLSTNSLTVFENVHLCKSNYFKGIPKAKFGKYNKQNHLLYNSTNLALLCLRLVLLD